MTIAHADTIAGLVKGLAVLESFDTERQRLNATLAALPRAELSAWLKGRVLRRITAHTVTAPRAFRAVLAQVAEQDYCVATDEHELGVHAVAVPLRQFPQRLHGGRHRGERPGAARGRIRVCRDPHRRFGDDP